MTATWRDVVGRFGMAAHPEGGWYVETWRASAPAGERARASAILFLLAAGEVSRWHRVDAAEMWHWYGGAPLKLVIKRDEISHEHRLGPNLLQGEHPQVLVPAKAWQTAESLGAWTLAGCTVAPGFDFAGFELAPDGFEP